MAEVSHNPDRFIGDLRRLLAQGRKRVGILLGAGAPLALCVNDQGELDPTGRPIIPAVDDLTAQVIENLSAEDRRIIDQLRHELGDGANIEAFLSKIRLVHKAIGTATLHGLQGKSFSELAKRICSLIGKIVDRKLPTGVSAYTHLVSWIGGTAREHPIEIFTPNYDLLLEESLERMIVPYFDGFAGASRPFFDTATVFNNDLPSRWVRLWKLHGSLGWEYESEGLSLRVRCHKPW